ncbi:DUF4150 domain-containing protein [Roseateles sp. SL47]|uniref:RHS repeat-associated core domain-containing protein n=1 Tax=Roseateles sp. SL47 TaxID=2995138 RepID=UPI0022709D58|nr:PAAR-like domain-containing protein [Roseateles sp. SL47]WAC70935.1 DUF4150 domain-containing protein [Roseateles sp. SL47]
MARETVTRSKRFFCVSLQPDVCLTPVGSSVVPIPYPIKGEFKEASAASPNVKHQSDPAVLHGQTFIPKVTGDARGVKGGVKSGTYEDKAEPKDKSSTSTSNAKAWVREADLVWMNARNTVGRIYERGTAAAKRRLKGAAQAYRESGASEALHEFGDEAMETGGKVAAAGTATAVVGGGVALTGVGAPVGGAIASAGGAVTAVGGGVTAVGAATGTATDVLDATADWVLDDKAPSLGALAEQAAERGANWALTRLPGGGRLLARLFPKKHPPAKQPDPKSQGGKHEEDKADGGKTQKPAQDKQQPKECCPQSQGPGKAATRSRRPIHFGTGDELLSELDADVDGLIPLTWLRTYRSSHAAYDRGLLGARWTSPYLVRLSVGERGMAYHDGTGRTVHLPPLAAGGTVDDAFEAFTLTRVGPWRFELRWRDGSVDVFERPRCDALALDVLPLGLDGLKLRQRRLLDEPAPRMEWVQCCYLVEQRRPDGLAVQLEWLPGWDARMLPERLDDDFPVLRITAPGEVVLEAHAAATGPLTDAQRACHGALKIGRLVRRLPVAEEAADEVAVTDAAATGLAAKANDATQPRWAWQVLSRYAYGLEHLGENPRDSALSSAPDLLGRKDAMGHLWRYYYDTHLLTRYVDPTGGAWVVRWQGADVLFQGPVNTNVGMPDGSQEVVPQHRGSWTALTSHWARAIYAAAEDGTEPVYVDYVDADTTQVRQADNSIWTYRFNANNLCVDVRVQDAADAPARRLGTRRWSTAGDLLEETDANGHTTRFTYDEQGSLISTTDALGGRTVVQYNEQNLPVRTIDAMGYVQEREFDAQGRLVTQTDALGRVNRMVYNAVGQLVQRVDAAGRVKRYEYDSQSRLVAHIDCSGYETRFAWDLRGRLISQTDAMGQSVYYGWDELDRLVFIRRPGAGEERFVYDALGRLLTQTDGVGRQTRYAYQMQGLPVERVDAAGQRLQYRYDRALRLVALINSKGESFQLAYDARGRLVQEIGFDGLVSRYDYDAAGELIASHRGAIRTDYVRDALGRLLTRVTPDGQERFAWDPLSRIIAVENAAAQSRLEWDAAGQLVEERQRIELAPEHAQLDAAGQWPDTAARGAMAVSFLLRHDYDALGQRIATRLPNGRVVQTQRYGAGHWHGILWQGQSLADVERDVLHRETRRSLGGLRRGGLRREVRYDGASRWSRSAFGFAETAPGALRQRDYGYARAGEVERISDSVLGELHFTRDDIGQLLTASQPGLVETFAFDPAGNLTPLPGITQALGWHYEHDVDGNAVRKHWVQDSAANEPAVSAAGDELRLHYDAHQRLILAERMTPHGVVTSRYAYDAIGRRVLKRVQGAGDEQVTAFVWNGDLMVQEVDAQGTVSYVHEPDSFTPLARVRSQESITSFATASVAFAPVLAWDRPDAPDAQPDAHVRLYRRLARWRQDCLDERTAQARWDGISCANDEVLYYECDHLGTPLALMDAVGRVRWRARYRAWGRLARLDVDEVAQPWRFQGQYEDGETGLYYNRHRYYDPDAGRYLTQDPIGLLGGFNSYQYAPDPTGWVDPLGLTKGKGGCDPCCGKDPSAEARAWQGVSPKNPNNIYTGVDTYENVVLKKGTILYSLHPGGAPGFAVQNHTLLKAKGNVSDYYDLVQVSQDPGKDAAGNPRTLRQGVRAYRVNEDICVARGKALANPQFGPGGGTQYYVSPTDVGRLSPGKIRPI